MNASQHYTVASAEFLKLYGITLKDAGFDEAMFHERYGDLEPTEAALQCGEAYDLDRVDLGWR